MSDAADDQNLKGGHAPAGMKSWQSSHILRNSFKHMETDAQYTQSTALTLFTYGRNPRAKMGSMPGPTFTTLLIQQAHVKSLFVTYYFCVTNQTNMLY